MRFSRDFQMRLRNAGALKASPWISVFALSVGAVVARVLVFLAPAGGGDVEKAKALGIVSVSNLAGHSKSADSLAYALGLAGAIITSVGIWIIWAIRASRDAAQQP